MWAGSFVNVDQSSRASWYSCCVFGRESWIGWIVKRPSNICKVKAEERRDFFVFDGEITWISWKHKVEARGGKGSGASSSHDRGAISHPRGGRLVAWADVRRTVETTEEPWVGSFRFLFTTLRAPLVFESPIFTQITIKRNDKSILVETIGIRDKSWTRLPLLILRGEFRNLLSQLESEAVIFPLKLTCCLVDHWWATLAALIKYVLLLSFYATRLPFFIFIEMSQWY